MTTTDYDSNDECVCGSDAAALGSCKVCSVPLSQLIALIEQESESSEEESEEVEHQNK